MTGDQLWRALVGAFHCFMQPVQSLTVEQRLAFFALVLTLLTYEDPLARAILLAIAFLLILI